MPATLRRLVRQRVRQVLTAALQRFSLPGSHTEEAALAQRFPEAIMKKRENNWING